MQQCHDFTQNFQNILICKKTIKPLVALFTYSQETLAVQQHCHMSFIDNTILKLSLVSCTTLLCIKALLLCTSVA